LAKDAIKLFNASYKFIIEPIFLLLHYHQIRLLLQAI